jgi:Fur family ferric uptake transcriptional regulator
MPGTDSISAAAKLRAAGLRVTGPRIAVLGALAARGHADVDALAQAGRTEVGALSNQAVYDMLRVFVSAGLARRIEPAGHPALFEARTGDNHHHVVCRGCGRVADVDCVVGERPCLTPSQVHGFVLDEAEVTFWGLCPRCSGAAEYADDVTRESEEGTL